MNKKVESGDRLGFGIVYPAIKNQPGDRACQVIVVYCTINGDIVYHRPMEQPAGGFYPVTNLFKYGKCDLLFQKFVSAVNRLELDSATTSVLQPAAGHSLSFIITFVTMTLAEACLWGWPQKNAN